MSIQPDTLPQGELPHDSFDSEDPTAPATAPQPLTGTLPSDSTDTTTVVGATETAPTPDLTTQVAQAAVNAAPMPAGNLSVGQRIVEYAKHYLGVPYVWGGTTAAGLDCSGLVQLVYKQAGINLPRISFQQANAGQRVAIKNLRPGDLVAVDNSPRNAGADHIAIYAGNGYIIEAPHPGGHVQYVPVSYMGKGAYGVRMGW